MPALVVVALTGPMLSAGLFTFYASTLSDVTVALIGLIGTCISSGTAMFVTIRTQKRITRVERKVSTKRVISASAGDDGEIAVQPPDIRGQK